MNKLTLPLQPAQSVQPTQSAQSAKPVSASAPTPAPTSTPAPPTLPTPPTSPTLALPGGAKKAAFVPLPNLVSTKPSSSSSLNSFLFYGDTKAGKSTSVAALAYWFYQTHKLKTRIVLFDGGGAEAYETLRQMGIVEILPAQSLNPITALAAIAAGKWLYSDASGKRQWVEYEYQPDKGEFGMIVTESLSSAADRVLAFAVSNDVGFKAGNSDTTTDSFGQSAPVNSPSKGNYGNVGGIMLSYINTSQGLFSKGYRYVGYTSHELILQNENDAVVKIGVGIVGKSLSTSVPKNIGDLFHFTSVRQKLPSTAKDAPPQYTSIRRCYITPHQHGTMSSLMWPASLRTDFFTLPLLAESPYAEGYIDLSPSNNVDKIFQWRETARESQLAKLKIETMDIADLVS